MTDAATFRIATYLFAILAILDGGTMALYAMAGFAVTWSLGCVILASPDVPVRRRAAEAIAA